MATLTNSINANAVTPLSTTQGGSGVSAPTAHGILVAEGASAFATKVLTNGQLLIGSTGADPVGAVLTSTGSTVTITNGAGTINLEVATPSGENWINVTTAGPINITPGDGYATSFVGGTTFILPATAAYGTVFEITGIVAGWSLTQNTGQSIQFGNLTTTVSSGTINSTLPGDSIRVICIVANTTFKVLASLGEMNVG